MAREDYDAKNYFKIGGHVHKRRYNPGYEFLEDAYIAWENSQVEAYEREKRMQSPEYKREYERAVQRMLLDAAEEEDRRRLKIEAEKARAEIEAYEEYLRAQNSKNTINNKATEYITVTRCANGEVDVFVGGKTAREFHFQEIFDSYYIKQVFTWMQKQYPEIVEFHIGAFATEGRFAQTGEPSSKFGSNAWCRVTAKDGFMAPWVYNGNAYTSAESCAHKCAYYCIRAVHDNPYFRSMVINPVINNNTSKQKTR